MLLAACRRADTGPQNVLPTPTPTPISTPLPPVATAIPPGSETNPITMLVNPASSGASARTALARVASDLQERTGLSIEVQSVESDAQSLAAVCDSVGGAVSVAWVGGLTAVAAQAQGCGTPVVWGERGTGRRVAVAESVQLVSRAESRFSTVASLSDARFCRVAYDDVQTWLVPTLILQAEGIDPLALDDIDDFDGLDALLSAVMEGECDAAGMPAGMVAASDAGALRVLAESAPIPYAVLVYPNEMPLTERIALENALVDLITDTTARAPLRDLLGVNRLHPVNADHLDALAAYIQSAGVELAHLAAR